MFSTLYSFSKELLQARGHTPGTGALLFSAGLSCVLAMGHAVNLTFQDKRQVDKHLW